MEKPSDESIRQDKYEFLEVLLLRCLHENTSGDFQVVAHDDDNFYLILKGTETFIIEPKLFPHTNCIDEEEFLHRGDFSVNKSLERIHYLNLELSTGTRLNYVTVTNRSTINHEFLEPRCDNTLNFLHLTRLFQINLNASPSRVNFFIAVTDSPSTQLNLLTEYLSSRYRISTINSKLILERFYTFLVNNLRHDLTKRDISLALLSVLFSKYKVDLCSISTYDPCHFNSAFSDITSDKLITVVERDPLTETLLKRHTASVIAKSCTEGRDWNRTYQYLWGRRKISLLLHAKSQEDLTELLGLVRVSSCSLSVIILCDGCPQSHIHGRFTTRLDKVTETTDAVTLLTRNDIVRLVANNYVAARGCCSSRSTQLPPYFIERTFLKVIVKFEILKEVSSEVFVVQNEAGGGSILLTTLQNWNLSNVYVVETGELAEELVCTSAPVHFMLFYGENWLEWKNSLGDSASICKYNVSHQVNISCTLTDVLGDRRNVKLLSAKHGKSLLLRSIALRIPSDCSVLTVQLERHCDYYKAATGKNAADHLLYFNSAAQCERCFTTQTQQLHILLDGYDQVPPAYTDIVLEIIASFKSQVFCVWLCARDVAAIEKRLGTVHTVVTPFSLKKQEDFLTGYFAHAAGFSAHALDFVRPLLQTLKSHLEQDGASLTGSPSHLKLVADVFVSEFKHFLITGVVPFRVKFEPLHFLDAFLSKNGFSQPRDAFLALKLVFGESVPDLEIDRNNEQFLTEHSVFAEYLAAKWMYEHLISDAGRCAALSKKRFEDLPRYRRTFKLFDYLLTRRCTLLRALIDGKAYEIELLTASHPDCHNEIDAIGRTPVHMAALYGVHHPEIFNNVIAINDETMVNIVMASDLPSIEARDTLLAYTPLDYALLSGTLAVANAICAKAPELLNNVHVHPAKLELYYEYCHKVNAYKPLYKALLKYTACSQLALATFRPNSRFSSLANLMGFNEVTEQNVLNYLQTYDVVTINHLLEKLQLKIPDSRCFTNVLLASAFGLPNNVVRLLWKGESVNNLGDYFFAPLHSAVTHARLDNVNALLSMGAEIDAVDAFGNSSLHLACRSNYNLASVEALLNLGADVDMQNNDGDTPLHCAIQFAAEEVIQLFLPDELMRRFFLPDARGFNRPKTINVNLQNKKGDTPLLLALQHKCTRIARKLLAHRADPRLINKTSYSCLHYAVQADHYDIVSELIHNYVDVNVRNDDGETPVLTALRFRHMDIAHLLTSAGADVNITDNHGMHCLHYAVIANVEAAMQQLLDKGVSVDVQSNGGETPLITAIKWSRGSAASFLLAKGANPNIADGEGCDALHHAALQPCRYAITALISLSVDIDKRNSNGETPLLLALKHHNISTAKLLIAKGADAEVRDKNGATTLHLAASIPSLDLVRVLLKKKLDVNLQNDEGDTPLLIAIQRYNKNVMKLLLANGADVSIENTNGFAAIHYAAQSGVDEILTLLINSRVDVNKKNRDGNTPLMLHIQNAFHPMTTLELLIDNGADVPTVNGDGNSALHFAVENGDSSSADCLISHGSQINLQNNDGDSPLHLAIKRGFTSVAQLLLDKGADANIVDRANGNSALHCAVNAAEDDIVQALLIRGVDTTLVNNDGDTALMRAQRLGTQSIITMLQQRSAVHTSSTHLLFSAIKNGDVYTVNTLIVDGCAINAQNESGDTPLLLALQERNVAIVDLLLAKGADTEPRNNSGASCVHYAASGGDSKTMRHLLSRGCDLNAQNIDGDTALLLALGARNKHLAQMLLDAGADTDLVPASNSKGSCLHSAVEEGADEIAAQILQGGFYIDKLNKYGSTPLLQATTFRNPSSASMLIRNGADVNAENESAWTCLHYAASYQFMDLTKLLLARGAHLNAMSENLGTPFLEALQADKHLAAKLLLRSGAHVATKNLWGGHAIHYAASQGFDDIVSDILDRGFDINKTDEMGNSPLFCALRNSRLSTTQLLLARGARVNIHNDSHYTCLQLAADAGFEELVRQLIDDGCDVNEENDDSYTALHLALRAQHVNIVKMLFKTIIAQELRDGDNSYLHYAAEFGDNAIVRALIEKGYDVNKQNSNDRSPLVIALQHNNVSTARLLVANGACCNDCDSELSFSSLYYFAQYGENELLLQALEDGVDVNVRSYDGYTPLAIATKHQRFSTVQLLLTHGADPSIRDDNDQNPLHYAVECNSLRMLAALLDGFTDTSCIYSLIADAIKLGYPNLANVLLKHATNDVERAAATGDDCILQQAAIKGYCDLVTAVVEKFGNVDQTNKDGDTALMSAYKNADEGMIELLLKLGANPSIANKDAFTCLHFAVKCSADMLIQTWETSDDREVANKSLGFTPFLYAVYEGDWNSALLLIECGANVHAEDKYANTALHLAAAKAGASDLARFLAETPLDVNKRNSNGETCWDVAINNGQLEIIALLLDHDPANAHKVNKSGKSAILIAVEQGDEQLVAKLLEMKVDLNTQCNQGQTPFLMALENRNAALAKLLISNGADVNVRNACGSNLHYAVTQGVEIVKELLELGLDIDEQNENGDTPLLVALRCKMTKLAKLLMARGANVNTRNNDGNSCLHYAIENVAPITHALVTTYGADVNKANTLGDTPLLQALRSGKKKLAKFLLANGADFNVCNNYGNSCLYYAAKAGFAAFVSEFISKGVAIDQGDQYSVTPLLAALKQKQESTVKVLIENGASVPLIGHNIPMATRICQLNSIEILDKILARGFDINQCTGTGTEPLLLTALKTERRDMANFLIAKGANVHLTSYVTGASCLHYAAKVGYDDTVEYLIKEGLDINRENNSRETPLRLAIINKRCSTIKLLLAHGASVAGDVCGCTYLHCAAELTEDRDGSITLELVKRGCELNAFNADGNTPLCVSVMSENWGTAKALLENGARTDCTNKEGYDVLHYATLANAGEDVLKLIRDAPDRS